MSVIDSLLLRRRARVGGSILVALTFAASGLVAPRGAGAGTVDSDRAQIAQLEKEIASQGSKVESLIASANEARAHLDKLHQQIRHDEVVLASDQRDEQAARSIVQRAAVAAYMNRGGSDNATLSMFTDTSTITQALGATHYLSSINANWNDAISTLKLNEDRTQHDREGLLAQQNDAQHTLDRLTKAQADTTAAINSENQTLQHVKGHLTALLIQAKKQKEAAARRAAEQALAAAIARATAAETSSNDGPTTPGGGHIPGPPPAPIPLPPPGPSPGGYANPMRGVSGLSPERIDSGVDYSGFGSVTAIGNGVVLSTYGSGWPGGTFIAYRLSDGPAAGLVVYVAEDINPTVSVGQSVTASTVIGQMFAGPHGIETGWADGSRLPNAMARSSGQYHGGNSTAFGYNFSRLLQALGAPGGILQNNPPTGSLPGGWPNW